MADGWDAFPLADGGGGGGGGGGGWDQFPLYEPERQQQPQYQQQAPPPPPPQQQQQSEWDRFPQVEARDTHAYRNEPWPDTAEGFKKKFGDTPGTDEEMMRYYHKGKPEDFNPFGQPEPKPEGVVGTALRKFGHSVLPTVASVPGFVGGMAIGAPSGPGSLVTGVAGGAAAYAGTHYAQESALKAMGYDDSLQQAVNAKANPWASWVGENAAALVPFGGGAAKLATRAIGAVAGAGMETFNQTVGGEEKYDPYRIAASAGLGATLTRPRAGTEVLGSATARAVGKPELWHGSAGSEAAGGDAQAHPPPSRGNLGDDVPNAQTRVDSLDPRVFHGEEPPAAAAAAAERQPGPRVTSSDVDPALTAAVQGTPIEPRVFHGDEAPAPGARGLEPRVTEEGMPPPGARAPEPRVTEMGAEPATPGVENLAPRMTPREEIAQRPAGERIGDTLRRLAEDERGGARLPRAKLEPDPNVSASDYAQQMSDMRDNKPRPINKLWRNLETAEPSKVAAAKADLANWNREYTRLGKLHKMALERDNAAFAARQEEPTTPAPGQNVQQLMEEARQRQDLAQRGYSNADIERMTSEDVARLHEIPPESVVPEPKADLDDIPDFLRRTAPTKEELRASVTPTPEQQAKINADLAEANAKLPPPSKTPLVTPEQVAELRKTPAELRAEAAPVEPKQTEALWRNKDVDLPVRVMDEPPHTGPDGRAYQRVMYEGKESFVPADELTAKPGRTAPGLEAVDAAVQKTVAAEAPEAGVRQTGELQINKLEPEGAGYALMRGNETIGEFKTQAAAARAYTKAANADLAAQGKKPAIGDLGKESVLDPTGGHPPQTPSATPKGSPTQGVPSATAAHIQQAAQQGVQGRGTTGQQAAAGAGVGAGGGGTGGGPPVVGPPPGGPPPPGPATAAQQLQPANPKDLADGIWATIQRIFAPEIRPSGRTGMDIFRQHAGWADRMQKEHAARFDNETWKHVNAMSDMDQRKWINHLEGGKELKDPNSPIYDPNWRVPPELQKASTDFKQSMKDWENEIKTWPQALQTRFRDEYVNHMWKNPPPTGGGGGISQRGSLRQRTHETDEAGRLVGLEPVTTNPLERLQSYAMAMGRVMTEFKTQTQLQNEGLLGWFKPKAVGGSGTPNPYIRGGPPDGYSPVNGWTDNQGRQAYVPHDMSILLNNQFAKHGGFGSEGTQSFVDGVRRFKNFTTAAELGFSLYHPFTVGFETIGNGVTRAFQQLGTGPGSFERATKSFIKAWVDPIGLAIPMGPKSFRQQHGIPDPMGQKWIEMYEGKRPINAQDKRILDALTAGGIRPVGVGHTIDFDLSAGGKGSLYTAFKRGSLEKEFNEALQSIRSDWKQIPKVAINAAARILETSMQPIFQHYIPRLKMASMALDMQAYLHANPNATDAQLQKVARMFSDSQDNRLGEMNADHMGMNKVVKAMAFTGLRSFSFTIGGPGREVGGGAYAGIKGAINRENTLSMSSPAFKPSTGYAIGFPATLVGVASIWNFMRTGEFPQDWRDAVVPRTGGTVKSGGQMVPERVITPGYHKDFLGYAFHPLDEVKAKMAAPWNALLEQITGKDYRGDPIAPPASAAGYGAMAAGRAKTLASHILPISSKQIFETPKEGSEIGIVQRSLGFRAPGAYLQNPERIEQVKDIVDRKAWRTKERHDNADRESRGLPKEPPMKFENEPEKMPRKRDSVPRVPREPTQAQQDYRQARDTYRQARDQYRQDRDRQRRPQEVQ